LETAMTLIAGAGDSKSYALEAIANARARDFAAAHECLDKAKAAMVEAHDLQTELIRDEMGGKSSAVNLLMVHAQDHMMGAILSRELAEEFISLYEAVDSLKHGSEAN
jgi:PTS system cellobiose-specific IIA component